MGPVDRVETGEQRERLFPLKGTTPAVVESQV
jgi:hypothetical protein